MSAFIERHPCGCVHLVESCDKCWGLLSPTTEAAFAARIERLRNEGKTEVIEVAIGRRDTIRAFYTVNYRPVGKEAGRG